MRKRFVLFAFASMFLLSAVIGGQLIVAVAAQRTVGVSPGDWAEYSITWSGNGTMPTPDEMVEWVKITVQGISGTNITYEEIMRYADTTEETITLVVDVDTGQGNGSAGFVAANLNAGDLIYTSPGPGDMFYGMTINETIFRMYLGEGVEVNHWNVTYNDGFFEYYWYRATGMLAEAIWYQSTQQADNMTWVKTEGVIIDVIPEFPPALILPLFMIATLTTVWLGKTIWSTKKSIKKHSPCA